MSDTSIIFTFLLLGMDLLIIDIFSFRKIKF